MQPSTLTLIRMVSAVTSSGACIAVLSGCGKELHRDVPLLCVAFQTVRSCLHLITYVAGCWLCRQPEPLWLPLPAALSCLCMLAVSLHICKAHALLSGWLCHWALPLLRCWQLTQHKCRLYLGRYIAMHACRLIHPATALSQSATPSFACRARRRRGLLLQ